jgi:hypothetical protein
MKAARRWAIGYLVAVIGGFALCTLHWNASGLFQDHCGSDLGQLSRYGALYLYGGLLIDAVCLLAAIGFGILFLRAQFRLLRRPYFTAGVGVLAVLALAAYVLVFDLAVVSVRMFGIWC